MNNLNPRILLILSLLSGACSSLGQGKLASEKPVDADTRNRGLTWRAGRHTLDSFVGWTTALHIGAVGTTAFSATGELDARVQRWAAGLDETVSVGFAVPALAGGMLAPVALPLGMYLFSDDPDVIEGAAAASQSVVIAFLANTFLKAITGRTPPDSSITNLQEVSQRSQGFRFGFLRGGVWDGWPSGHSMVNMALAASLASYFDDYPWVQIAAYGWAAYVMTSVTIGMQGDVHWLSDAVAGGLMGFCIGWTIGSDFATESTPGFLVMPVAYPAGMGLHLMLPW